MDRSNFVVQDIYGVDPLASDLIDRLMSIEATIEHEVKSDEESNPQLIAFDYYKNVELYFVITYYNGIGNSFDLKRGLTIRIPSPSEVQRILTEQKYVRKTTSARTMEI